MNLNRRTACLSMDIESDLHSPNPHIELFSNPHYFDQFRAIIHQEGVPVTAFLVTQLLQQMPELIGTVHSKIPLRFEVHSHSHQQSKADSESEILSAKKIFENELGYSPEGYRAPNGLISKQGLSTLADAGFVYDSSLFPSIRIDEFGYNHLSMPIDPFIFLTPKPILELPVGVIPRVRLVVSISYIKLLGWTVYKTLIRTLGLPKTVIILCHPYDFTIRHNLPYIRGWKKYAHARNAGNGMKLLRELIRCLKGLGYRFEFIGDVVKELQSEGLHTISTRSLRDRRN